MHTTSRYQAEYARLQEELRSGVGADARMTKEDATREGDIQPAEPPVSGLEGPETREDVPVVPPRAARAVAAAAPITPRVATVEVPDGGNRRIGRR